MKLNTQTYKSSTRLTRFSLLLFSKLLIIKLISFEIFPFFVDRMSQRSQALIISQFPANQVEFHYLCFHKKIVEMLSVV